MQMLLQRKLVLCSAQQRPASCRLLQLQRGRQSGRLMVRQLLQMQLTLALCTAVQLPAQRLLQSSRHSSSLMLQTQPTQALCAALRLPTQRLVLHMPGASCSMAQMWLLLTALWKVVLLLLSPKTGMQVMRLLLRVLLRMLPWLSFCQQPSLPAGCRPWMVLHPALLTPLLPSQLPLLRCADATHDQSSSTDHRLPVGCFQSHR